MKWHVEPRVTRTAGDTSMDDPRWLHRAERVFVCVLDEGLVWKGCRHTSKDEADAHAVELNLRTVKATANA